MSLRLAAALCAALVAVAGCAGDPERPGTVPSKAAPSPTSSSPSTSPQTIEEEVEAAVRAYFEELNRASETNDTTRLKTLSSRNCPCYRTVRVINQIADDGERLQGLRWELRSLRVHDVLGRTAQVEVKFDTTRHRVVTASGKTVQRVPASSNRQDWSVIEGEDGWIITNIIDLSGG